MPPELSGPEGAYAFLNIIFCLSLIVLPLGVFALRSIEKRRSGAVDTGDEESAGHPLPTTMDSVDENPHGRVYRLMEQKPLTLPILLGGLAVLPLPAITVLAKIIMCGYGLGEDLTGVYLLLPVFVVIAVVLGAVAGGAGWVVGQLLDWLTKARSAQVIGTAVGSLLAIVMAVLVSLFFSGMLLFPDC